MAFENKSDAFLSLVETHKGILYKVSHAYCRDPEDRKDLVQEIILQLWRSFDRYDNRFQHSTWIYRIALNVAISFYRKETTRKTISNPITENIVQRMDEADKGETETGIRFLHQCIAELKELDKALMLLYLEGKSHKEIAEIIGITETNTATKISRIKTLLKQRFSQTNL
ncbi:MAG: RNA polymerase sigma factor [Bacteroidota bacterium]|nr:RNA polymerase sigma factor [Bacteroidota bacterium]